MIADAICSRWLHTGGLVRFDADGYVKLVDRLNTTLTWTNYAPRVSRSTSFPSTWSF